MGYLALSHSSRAGWLCRNSNKVENGINKSNMNSNCINYSAFNNNFLFHFMLLMLKLHLWPISNASGAYEIEWIEFPWLISNHFFLSFISSVRDTQKGKLTGATDEKCFWLNIHVLILMFLCLLLWEKIDQNINHCNESF